MIVLWVNLPPPLQRLFPPFFVHYGDLSLKKKTRYTFHIFRIFHVHLEATFPRVLAFCLHCAIFRFLLIVKNGILCLIQTFELNCVAKTLCLHYLLQCSFFFKEFCICLPQYEKFGLLWEDRPLKLVLWNLWAKLPSPHSPSQSFWIKSLRMWG